MEGEGMANDTLKSVDWNNYDMRMVKPHELEIIEDCIGKFFMAHTKAELYEGVIKRNIMLCPVNTVKDIVEDRQLESRKFWQQIEHPQLTSPIKYPGSSFRFSEIESALVPRIPYPGQHNQEIYEGDLGLSPEEILRLKDANVI